MTPIQKAIEEALKKLSNEEFDWSADCGDQLPYDEWVVHIAQEALAALRAVNETHVMVPREPSEEMWEAVDKHIDEFGCLGSGWYQALIEAAQKDSPDREGK